MAEVREVPVTNLLVDVQNPRLPEEQGNQIAAIHAMLANESAKTLALVEAIASEGFSRIERLLVTASPDHDKRFIVLEGNRRLTALKLLLEPKLGEPVLSPAQRKKLTAWSEMYLSRNPDRSVECYVFESRDEADPFIERRHVGDQGGKGIVRWGATESARFNARRRGRRSRELQILDYVSQHPDLDESTRERMQYVSITNLKRMISDNQVREALGLGVDSEGRIQTNHTDASTIQPLLRIVSDLAHERVKVKDIYTAADRKKYLRRLKSELPAASSRLAGPEPLGGGGRAAAAKRVATLAPRKTTSTRLRTVLIPSSCSMVISNPKILQIFRELRKLDLSDFSNAIAVLFRVFVELSVDHLIEGDRMMLPQQAENTKLREKLKSSAEYLEKHGRLTKEQAKAARGAAQDQHLLHTSITTMHLYVHSKHYSPRASDLRASWDNLQPFLEAIWK